MESQRDSKRIKFNQKIKYGSDEVLNTDATSLNLSPSGIAIKSYRTVTPGTRISLILFTGDKPIRLDGEVIWNSADDVKNDAEMGIKIISRKDQLTKVYRENLEREDG